MQMQIINYLSGHGFISFLVGSSGMWVFNNIVSVFVSSMPAPTRNSSEKYKYWFKVLNTIVGNISRARSTHIENSPNWQDAVDQHVANGNGTAQQGPNTPNSQPPVQ